MAEEHLDSHHPHLTKTERELYAPSLGGSIQDEDVEPITPLNTWITLCAVCFGFFAIIQVLTTGGLQKANVAGAHGHPELAIWTVNAGTVVTVSLSPPLARISDHVGRKWICVVCTALGVIGLIMIAVSNNIATVLAGSCLIGLQGSVSPIQAAIASEILPRKLRPMAQGIFNNFAVCGSVVGATLGQFISTKEIGSIAGWRFDYWFCVMTSSLSTILLIIGYHPPPTPNPLNRSYLERWLDFDIGGTLLLTLATVPFVMGLTWGGGEYPWKSAHAIAPTIVGAVLFVALGFHQFFIKKDGLFNHRLFQHKNFFLVMIMNFVEGVFYFTYNSYFGEEIGYVFDARPVHLGLQFSAFAFAAMVGYTLVPIYCQWRLTIKSPLVAGYILYCAIMIGLSQLGTNHSSQLGLIACGALAGVAFTPAETLLNTGAQLAVPPELIGTGTAIQSAVRSLGGVIGLAAATSIFNSKVTKYVTAYMVPALAEAGLAPAEIPAFIGAITTGETAALAEIPGITPTIIGAGVQAFKRAFSKSFSFIWYFELAFCVLALVAACFLGSVKEQMSWIINRPVDAIHHKHHLGHGEEVAQTDSPGGTEKHEEQHVEHATKTTV